MPEPKNSKWFHDYLSPDEGHIHGIRAIPFAKQTKYQYVEIMETASYGRCLVLDGKMNSSQADEFIYHEALVHPALLTHPNPRRVAILGGGEGATLREILRYPSIRRAVMVDIDDEVVEICKRYLPEMHQGAFDDPRTAVVHEDARAYLENSSERYDLIISDLVEPLEEGPACLLYSKEFYRIVHDRLTPGGTFTMQAGMTKVGELAFFTVIHHTLREVFPIVAPYQTPIPCFGTSWGFMLAGKKVDPRRQDAAAVDRLIADRIKGELGYWDGQTHQHVFALPKHLRKAIDAETRVATDKHPLTVA